MLCDTHTHTHRAEERILTFSPVQPFLPSVSCLNAPDLMVVDGGDQGCAPSALLNHLQTDASWAEAERSWNENSGVQYSRIQPSVSEQSDVVEVFRIRSRRSSFATQSRIFKPAAKCPQSDTLNTRRCTECANLCPSNASLETFGIRDMK